MSEDIIKLLIYHQPGVKLGLTLHPFGVLGYVAGHSLTMWWLWHGFLRCCISQLCCWAVDTDFSPWQLLS